MKTHFPTERFGFVEKEYSDIADMERNYVKDYCIIRKLHIEAIETFIKDKNKIKEISAKLIEMMKETK